MFFSRGRMLVKGKSWVVPHEIYITQMPSYLHCPHHHQPSHPHPLTRSPTTKWLEARGEEVSSISNRRRAAPPASSPEPQSLHSYCLTPRSQKQKCRKKSMQWPVRRERPGVCRGKSRRRRRAGGARERREADAAFRAVEPGNRGGGVENASVQGSQPKESAALCRRKSRSPRDQEKGGES